MYDFKGYRPKSDEKIGRNIACDRANSMPYLAKDVSQPAPADQNARQSNDYLFSIIKAQTKTQAKMIKLISRVIGSSN